MVFTVGQYVRFAGSDSTVEEVVERDDRREYRIANGEMRLPMWVPEDIFLDHQATDHEPRQFRSRPPDLIAVDDFFHDPDEVRALALAQPYGEDSRFYKGSRSKVRFLWPFLREEFGRLLGVPVTEWLGYSANGVFQQTTHSDPLVWHHDTQQWAAAVYLTPDAPPASGTSFWRDKTFGCRRNPSHPLERKRLGSDEEVRAAEGVVYDRYNIEHPDNWELVEAVAGLYNRLVIWDARFIHSATSYVPFSDDGVAPTRLVQLFFFDAG